MINVSNRLLSIASFIENRSYVYDIGCDHGLLDVYLTLNKDCFCTAIDVNSTIISRARDSFIKYDVFDKINLVVGNGYYWNKTSGRCDHCSLILEKFYCAFCNSFIFIILLYYVY